VDKFFLRVASTIIKTKYYVHGLKIIFVLGKLVSSNGQNFCPVENYFVLDKFDFVPDKKCIVWADGQGTSDAFPVFVALFF